MNNSAMLSLRQILRIGTRLALSNESVNLRQIPLIFKERYNVIILTQKSFLCAKSNLCESPQENTESNNKHVLGKLEGKLKLMFTCKVCNHRNGKIISKIAYEKGLVIVRCDGCKNNHLISDNLGWFAEMRNTKNIEKFLLSKGESVRRIQNYADGYIEVVAKAELDLLQHNKDQEKPREEKQCDVLTNKKKVATSEET